MINKARLYFSLVVGALLCGGSFAVVFLIAITWPMGIFDIIFVVFMSLVVFTFVEILCMQCFCIFRRRETSKQT